jgi:hypothetical protein
VIEEGVHAWILLVIVKGDVSEYLDFEEISSKLRSILPKKSWDN